MSPAAAPLEDCQPARAFDTGAMPLPVQVLYAEDNPVDAELTRAHFARYAPEFRLEVVQRAGDFLPLARARKHDLLLLDQGLPDMDGLAVLKLLALDGIDTPVVMVTGGGDGALASQALRLGAADYVPKRQGYLRALPQQLREVWQQRRTPRTASPSRVRPRRILLLEAASAADGLAAQLLAGAPHLVVENTRDAATALERLAQAEGYDLVLSEHQPPQLDGFVFMEALRQQGVRTPLILLAGEDNEDTVVTAFKLGASDCILKHERHYAGLALRIDLAIDRHELALANERAADELAERQRTVAALRESEKQLKIALEAGRVGLWSWQVGTVHTQYSSRWKAQIGYADNEIRQHASEWESRCHPDDFSNVQAMIARYLAMPWPDFTIEYRLRHKDGGWRWFILHADLELGPEGEPSRMIGSQVDITALKQQQAELSAASARLQQLSRRLLEVQEMERRHLARELHDEIGQVLTVTKIHLQSVVPETGGKAALFAEPIALIDKLLAQVRSLSLNLRPPLLDDLGLVPALHWLLQQHPARPGSPRIHLTTSPTFHRCDSTLETACFRIAQEALTNALRHARARNIELTLGIQHEALRLGVRDDGIGFDAAAARVRAERGGSLGLLGMHERASLAGGTLTLLSAPRRGTEVEAVFPLSNSIELS